MIIREICTRCGGSRSYTYHANGNMRSKTTKMQKECKHHWIITEEQPPQEEKKQ